MKELTFYKAHGIGNDFIIIDQDEHSQKLSRADYRNLCDRRKGVGADQIILIETSSEYRVRFLNADGSEAEMCGNGIRCAALYLWQIKGRTQSQLKINTLAGPKLISRREGLIQVDMGEPVLEGKEIPTAAQGRIINHPLKVAESTYLITALSMGNPHCVVFGPENRFDLPKLGSLFENHPFFPNRTNFEYVTVIDRNHIKVKVWERGTGITLACGTGACASMAAACLNGLTGRSVQVDLPGGSLKIVWDQESKKIFMAGPAQIVYKGGVLPDFLRG